MRKISVLVSVLAVLGAAGAQQDVLEPHALAGDASAPALAPVEVCAPSEALASPPSSTSETVPTATVTVTAAVEPDADTAPDSPAAAELPTWTATATAPDDSARTTSAALADAASSSSASAHPEPLSTAEAESPSAVPLDDAPPAPESDTPPPPTDDSAPPEFLSFAEWREKYAVAPDPSARRSKKAAQRARQEAAAAASGASFDGVGDGDGADLGSLFASNEGSQIVYENEGTGEGRLVVQLAKNGDVQRAVVLPLTADAEAYGAAIGHEGIGTNQLSAPTSLSPIQPLPNVGTGHPTDPLLLLKDRYNYALFGCAAMVHRASRQTKGATSILVEKKDQYMLTPCAVEPKFVELELCDEIRIDTVVLANFEFFSSMFKKFSIKVSLNYPGRPDEWHDLGTFRARNVRGVQVFHPKAINGFYRYMRIEFLSHYGSEFYCPVSLLRVYGLTQMNAFYVEREQDLRREIALAAMADETEDDDELDSDIELDPRATVDEDAFWKDPAAARANATDVVNATEPDSSAPPALVPSAASESSLKEETPPTNKPEATAPAPPSSLEVELSSSTPTPTPSATTLAVAVSTTVLPEALATLEASSLEVEASSASPVVEASPSPSESSAPAPTTLPPTEPSPSSEAVATSSSTVNPPPLPPLATSTAESTPAPSASDTVLPAPSDSAPPSADSPSSSVATPLHTTTASRSAAHSATTVVQIISTRPLETAARPPRNETRPPILPPVQQPQPGESIYGTIMKRLTSLEHNQTLSMHYIEAQGNMLRDAFGRIEKRLGDVEASRSRHDQLIRQALLDFEKHHLEVNRDRLALASQVNLLTNELLLEKRLGVAQLVGLLALFVFVGMTRGSPTTPFLHMVQGQHFRRRFSSKEDGLQRSDERRRGEELRRGENRGESSGDAYRKHQRTGSMSARNAPAKRVAGPKAVPRRHYSGAASTSSKPKRPQSWTPPPHPSSAFLPDDAFLSSLATAFDRRRPSAKASGSPRPMSPLAGRPLALFQSSDPTLGETFASRPIASKPYRAPPASAPDEADTEPSSDATDDDFDPFSTSQDQGAAAGVDTDERGYRTLSDEDVVDDSAARAQLSKSASARMTSSSGWLGRLVKPPRSLVGKRPKSSPGLDKPETSSPKPPSRLPSPPPEPPAQLDTEDTEAQSARPAPDPL